MRGRELRRHRAARLLNVSLRIMSPRSPGEPAASPPMGTIDRRGRSAASRRVALAVDARRDSPKSSSCSRAARTWAARARSRDNSQARLPSRHA